MTYAIGGFGIVTSFSKLPEWLAWEAFGEGNGSSTFEEMQQRLALIRLRNGIGDDELKQIGCLVLSSVVFFAENQWIRQPSDWGRQNMRYKTYDLTEGEGLRIWRECQERSVGHAVDVPAMQPELGRWGKPALVKPRLGQGAFRVAVTDAYQRACAVTGEHSLPALEAAHIKPFSLEGPHTVRNGVLLRSDLHRLFDRGYITVTCDHRLEVSKRLKEHFSNGKSYYPLHGSPVAVPQAVQNHPDPELLRWHNEKQFRA